MSDSTILYNGIIMGRHSYGIPVRKGDSNKITIGKYCSIAEGVTFDGGFNHRTSFLSTYPFHRLDSSIESNIETAHDITIGNDVWIGSDVLIMAGCVIGDGAVIGARSVVTKNTKINTYTIWLGTPAEYKKSRFDHLGYEGRNKLKEGLLKLCWWDKTDEEVLRIAPLLMSHNFEELFKLYNI
jgi:acetyltransferase-like isoleucine patch superfamily enzyme